MWSRFVVKLLLKELAEYEKYNTFKNAKLYRIVNSVDEMVYIGWTNGTIRIRWNKHKCDFKKGRYKHSPLHCHFDKLGIDKFRIELLEKWPCKGRHPIHNREYQRQIEVPENLRLHIARKPLPPNWSQNLKVQYCIMKASSVVPGSSRSRRTCKQTSHFRQ